MGRAWRSTGCHHGKGGKGVIGKITLEFIVIQPWKRRYFLVKLQQAGPMEITTRLYLRKVARCELI
jgi:hypothetical protein